MFRGGQPNPYDDIVVKTTDENLTSENWELILNLCDKVQEEGEQGARSVIASVLKRLAHRNPNVQLYALALVEALSKNCGLEVNREISSRSFTQALERLVTDRTTHDKVKRKVLSLIYMWSTEFSNDPTLGIMEECYESLRAKNYKFEEPSEPPPPAVDDEIRRREEEELQRVLEMSMLDKGGRTAWDAYGSGSSSSAGPGPSSSTTNAGPSRSNAATSSVPPAKNDFGYAKAASGYVPARTPSPRAQATPAPVVVPSAAANPISATSGTPGLVKNSSQTSLSLSAVSRVRALHSFEATEQGELTFEKGDIIKVVDRNYKDWWRGQLKGRTGIFPVNYVELLPDPTPDDIAREAEQEATIFAQAANIDKLLSMLRGLDPARDNLADNEEIQELYRSSMALRPKIVKLIDKYSQKRAELVSMNETFIKARAMFDRMMEESLARHSALYDTRPPYQPLQQPSYRPDSRAHGEYRGAMYQGPYDPPIGYAGFPQPQPAYSAAPTPIAQHGPPVETNAVYPGQQPTYAQPPYGPSPQQGPTPYPAGAWDPNAGYAQSPYGQPVGPQAQAQPQGQQTQPQVHSQPQVQTQPQMQVQPQLQTQPQAQQPIPQNVSAASVQQTTQQNGYQDVHAAAVAAGGPQSQAQAQQTPAIQQGPPYVYDPNGTYPDPGAQAWAQYYAQGGTDPAGAVYFISVPGITDNQAPPAAQQQPQIQTQVQQQQSPQTAVEQQSQPQPQPQASASSPKEQTAFQAYPGPQGQPAQAESVPAYSAAQPHPQAVQNGSATSLPAQHLASAPGAEYASPTGPPQQQPQQQLSNASPTLTHAGSYFVAGGAPHQQPSSPGGTHHPGAQQQYPPSPYPEHTAGLASQAVSAAPTPYNAQYAQMQGQFAAMGMGEPRSPTGVAPAAQPA